MKTLYLLRHAKAEPGSKEVSDRDRALNARGRDACERVGTYMKEKGYAPALALCSPSRRTRETLKRVTQAAGFEVRYEFEEKLYLASAEGILGQISKCDDALGSLMIVGHNPGMQHVALTFSQKQRTSLRTALELKYPTCALAVLVFDITRWKALTPGEGEVADFITPASLA